VFFTRSNAINSMILVSRLIHGRWSKPQVAPFSGVWRDLEPAMAPDGSYMIFVSNRPTVPGGKPLDGFYNGGLQPTKGGNLWRVDRTSTGWSAPHRLPEIVNANASIYSPSVVADGSVYFMQASGSATRFHLFRAQFAHGSYGAPLAVSIGAEDAVGDFDPAVAPDESFMIFSSGRPPAKVTSLFITFRQNSSWSTPMYMGDAINNAADIEARLSPDHRTLYFSNRRLVADPTPSDHGSAARTAERMIAWNNGLLNIWLVPLDSWLRNQKDDEP
jgi:Tol biopolymer transport system component